jgi:hypothetical protein
MKPRGDSLSSFGPMLVGDSVTFREEGIRAQTSCLDRCGTAPDFHRTFPLFQIYHDSKSFTIHQQYTWQSRRSQPKSR